MTTSKRFALTVIGLALIAAGLFGCSAVAPEDATPVAAERPASFVTCGASISAPIVLAGENTGAINGALSYCYESRWDNVIQLGFRADGVDSNYLRINVDTKRVVPGWPVAIGVDGMDRSAAAWSSSCSGYEGFLILDSDEPTWSITLSARCADDGRELAGRWYGRTK